MLFILITYEKIIKCFVKISKYCSNTREVVHTWKKFKGWVWSYFQKENHFLLGDMEGVIRQIDSRTGAITATLKGMKGWGLGFVELQSGEVLSYGHKRTIPIWSFPSQGKVKPN